MKSLFSIAAIALFALAPQVAKAQPTVWVADPTDRITAESTAPADAPKGIHLVAPRGGFASGQVVVKSDAAPNALEVHAGPLGGPGAIPATAVQVRFPTRKVDLAGGAFEFGQRDYFDALAEKLVPGEKVQPVWITVNVPASAVAGNYKGELTIAARKIPLELTVADYTITQSRQLVTATLASPDSVALRYGVPPYSDAHFKLLESSLALQGRVGNNVLFIPVIGESYLGARFGLIQFRKNGNQLVPDFAAFDRYLALYDKYCGTPRIVSIYLWEISLSASKTKTPADTIEVTVIGKAGLETTRVPAYPASKELCKLVIDGVIQRVGKLGTKSADVLIGQSCDGHPTLPQVEMFKEIAPDMHWSAWTHGYGYSATSGVNGNVVGMFQSPDFTPSPGKMRGGWNAPMLRLNTLRSWVGEDTPPIRWRLTADLSCGSHKQGVCAGYGMVGLDYFPLPPDSAVSTNGKTPRARSLWSGPYPGLKYCRLDRGQASRITAAGPAGALSTVRLELLAEGAQEAEARITLEKAVAAKKLDSAKAGELLLRRGKSIMGDKDWEKNFKPGVTWLADLTEIYQLAGTVQLRP